MKEKMRQYKEALESLYNVSKEIYDYLGQEHEDSDFDNLTDFDNKMLGEIDRKHKEIETYFLNIDYLYREQDASPSPLRV